MKFTEGGFRDWGYALAEREFGAEPLDGGPWLTLDAGGRTIMVKDVIADAFLQQILLRPAEYDVIATLNLNGDYISDALAAQVGGIGIAPGANICDTVAMFEATHGTAPKYAGQDKVNPGSLILSAEMMLRHLGWREAADQIVAAMEAAIGDKIVTYDFARLMEDATEVWLVRLRAGDDRADVALLLPARSASSFACARSASSRVRCALASTSRVKPVPLFALSLRQLPLRHRLLPGARSILVSRATMSLTLKSRATTSSRSISRSATHPACAPTSGRRKSHIRARSATVTSICHLHRSK